MSLLITDSTRGRAIVNSLMLSKGVWKKGSIMFPLSTTVDPFQIETACVRQTLQLHERLTSHSRAVGPQSSTLQLTCICKTRQLTSQIQLLKQTTVKLWLIYSITSALLKQLFMNSSLEKYFSQAVLELGVFNNSKLPGKTRTKGNWSRHYDEPPVFPHFFTHVYLEYLNKLLW